MADSTLEQYSELVGLVIQGKFPIMPKPEWGQDAAYLGSVIDKLAAMTRDSSYLPLQGKTERRHLYEWVTEEEEYVAGKFDGQRDGHDETLKNYDIEEFWVRQIVQYLDRARHALQLAGDLKSEGESIKARTMEMKAQQAMAKCMMTAKALVESSIRVYGPLPKPAESSGYVYPWMEDDLVTPVKE